MSNELSNNKAQGQHGSMRDEACKAFEESSVCALSTILSNDSKPRKIFRSVVFLLFTVAFLYQCIAFLCYALQYPSVVDVETLRDETFIAPAYTLCNLNNIKRSKFCAKFPRNCTKPDWKFCEEHPRFCGTPDTLVLKDARINIDSKDELFLLNYDVEIFNERGLDEQDMPNGPLPRQQEIEMSIGACFTIRDRVNSPLEPFMKRRDPLGNGMGEEFTFEPEENELIHPDAKAGIMFQAHSPFEPVNPFASGYFMRPGYLYRIVITMAHEKMLPNDCLNYTEVWLKNNQTGYRSQVACKHKCMGDIIQKCMNCTEPSVLYPYPNETFCTYPVGKRHTGICASPVDSVKECMKNCKEDCEKIKFSYEIFETYRNRYNRWVERNESRVVFVSIEFPEAEMKKIIHKPQFQVLEIFSLIGGLLAFWIGLSMFQVIEVFDCMFQIVKSLVKSRSGGSERSTA